MHVASENPEENPRVCEALETLMRQRGIQPGVIAGLMRESEPFREICADYEECCGKLQSLEQKGAASAAQLRDYLEMRDQLERDLLRYLEVADPHCGRGKPVEQTKTE